MEVNPFLLSDEELDQWFKEEQQKENAIHNKLTELKFNTSLWRVSKKEFFIVSKSTKKENHIQLTFFRNNEPQYDIMRTTNNIKDIVRELYQTEATLKETIIN